MLLLWRIRYIDTRDGQPKDRDLRLDTDTLDPVTKATVEATYDLGDGGTHREMLQFRHLFEEEKCSKTELSTIHLRHEDVNWFCVPLYFEDEDGKEMTPISMGPAITGDPNTVMLPAGAKEHDVEFMFAPKPDIIIDDIVIPEDDLKVLSYFSRDFREMDAASFMAEKPGTVCTAGDVITVKTAMSEDEIRSFVMIFRRLCMAKEPGNFMKATKVFAETIKPHPLGKWVEGAVEEYRQELNSKLSLPSAPSWGGMNFTRKRLIDVFFYTQYLHQGEDRRERQYEECLEQVNNKPDLLYWLFLVAMWECALHIRAIGAQIASFTEAYCRCHNVNPSAVESASKHVGMGELEKRHERETRILAENVDKLAKQLWEQDGSPEGGHLPYIDKAKDQLRAAMTGPNESNTNRD